MPNKGSYRKEHRNFRREFLEGKTTEELQAALDPLTPLSQRKIFIGDGGITLIRQILAERSAADR